MRFVQVFVVCAALVAPAFAQLTLTTSFLGNTGQSGNMFDVVGVVGAVIDTVDVNISAGAATVEIYAVTGGGSFVPVGSTPAAWTLVGTATVVGAGTGLVTPVPVNLNIPIGVGQTQGLYVTTTASTMWYTVGTTIGAIWAQDANMQVLEGTYVAYPFIAQAVPRKWNGNIHYHLAVVHAAALTATTSGGGLGDLALALPTIPSGATEGYLLVSATALGTVGSGPLIGIYPDGITFALLQEPLNVGDPLHFVVGPAGVFPAQPFALPPGSLLLGGQVWDAVAAFFGPGFVYLGESNVQRLVW